MADGRSRQSRAGMAAPCAGRKPVAVISQPGRRSIAENFYVPLPAAGRWREILNTDAEIWRRHGQGQWRARRRWMPVAASARRSHLPPLAVIMLELEN